MDQTEKYVRSINNVGQVRIPVQVRKLLGLTQKGLIVFEIKGKKVEVRGADEREKHVFVRGSRHGSDEE
jgi:bifunctional DNA-binding transcriptional regulator/antitoxin component of YhaV-PrlF toxin-antitoxin module